MKKKEKFWKKGKVDSKYAKKITLFMVFFTLLTLVIFPLVTPLMLLGAIIWFYRYRQCKKMEKTRKVNK